MAKQCLTKQSLRKKISQELFDKDEHSKVLIQGDISIEKYSLT